MYIIIYRAVGESDKIMEYFFCPDIVNLLLVAYNAYSCNWKYT